MDLWVDTRWEGRHGIGRYAREVCSRLALPWRRLPVQGAPASPTDALSEVPEGVIYSPGYNAFLRADRQVLTIHDLIHLQTPWPGRAKYLAYYNAVVKRTVKRAGVVLTVSETSRAAITDWLKDPAVEVVNAGIGASPGFHTSVTPATAPTPYLMYVGNLRAHKNVRVVLDAIAQLPRARLRMLIPRDEHTLARRLFAERDVSQRVELLTGLTDDALAQHYRGAAATVMPSTLEGFGLPALESVLTGTPVIFSRSCMSVAETVGARGTAVASAGNVDEWRSAIDQALAAPVRVVPPPSRAYDWDTTASIVTAVLDA